MHAAIGILFLGSFFHEDVDPGLVRSTYRVKGPERLPGPEARNEKE
jgi:hypothetical protein